MLYFCKINDGREGGEEAGWQGPYESLSPRAAAGLWIKREWDCRHREIVPVKVRDEEGLIHAVNLRVLVTLVLAGDAGRLQELA